MQKNSTVYLKKTEAYARKKLIDNGAKYKLFFCLRKGEVYQGFTTVTFNTLSIVKKSIFLIYLGRRHIHRIWRKFHKFHGSQRQSR